MLGNFLVSLRFMAAGIAVAVQVVGTAALPLYPPDGIPYYLKDGSVPPELLKMLPQPATPHDAVRAVAANVSGGADIIKLFTGSWVARDHVLPMPAEVAIAAATEAHR